MKTGLITFQLSKSFDAILIIVKILCQSTTLKTNVNVDILLASNLILHNVLHSLDWSSEISLNTSYILCKSYLKGFTASTRHSYQVVLTHFEVKDVMCFFNTDHLSEDFEKKKNSSWIRTQFPRLFSSTVHN